MVHSCCVVGCSNRQSTEKNISLHRFPKYPLWRREAWIKALKRLEIGSTPGKQKPWQPTNSSRVCSMHFITGKPCEEITHPDFIPNQNLGGKNGNSRTNITTMERFKRSKKTKKTGMSHDETVSIPEHQSQEPDLDINIGIQCDLLTDGQTSMVTGLEKKLKKGTKANECFEKKSYLQEQRISKLKLSFSSMDAGMVAFYTGMTKALFLWIYDQIFPLVENKRQSRALSLHDHLLLVLVKIRLGLLNRDISYRFGITETSTSRILNIWIPVISKCLKPLIHWPERDVARSNVPLSFKPDYNKCVSIIDCFEIFIERPKNLTARAQTWSNYKHNNTVKYLISISPSGAINFLSSGWGGRVSDKEITFKSGFMENLMHGDEVLADRGFLLSEEMASQGVVLRIPSFTKDKKQLSGKDVETSRKLSHVRIHVERVIGRMRTFLILESNIPLCQVHLLDDIVTIIGTLHNLLPPIVKG